MAMRIVSGGAMALVAAVLTRTASGRRIANDRRMGIDSRDRLEVDRCYGWFGRPTSS
jgi:hypothetical protein